MNLYRVCLRGCLLRMSLFTLLGSPLLSQENRSSSQPVDAVGSAAPADQFAFKRNVNRVIVDVVVTDASGRPAHGLGKRDFTIVEGGKKQTILSFDVHEFGAGAMFVPKPATLPVNTFSNVQVMPEQGPLYVLLLDLYATLPDDQPNARQQLLKFIRSKPEGARFAIFVLSDGLYLVQGFTQDRDKLYAAVDLERPKPHVPRIYINNYNDVDFVTVFRSIADYLDGLPGHKNVIWFSGRFPLPVFATDGQDPVYQAKVVETLRGLAQTQIAIYPVDVRGVVALVGPATHKLAILQDDYQIEDEIARVTGGHAFYSRNDLSTVLSEATNLGGNYYSITYSPSNVSFDGKLRHIQVHLSKKGYILEYRSSYYARAPEQPALPTNNDAKARSEASTQRRPTDSLYANMQHGAPTSREILFQVHVYPLGPPTLATPEQTANLAVENAYFRLRKKKHPDKDIPPVKLQTYFLDYSVLGKVPVIEIALAAYDGDGVLLNADIEHTVPPNTSTKETSGAKVYRIQDRFDAPIGASYIRLAVRDVTTDRIGALEFSLPLANEPTNAAGVSERGTASPAQR